MYRIIFGAIRNILIFLYNSSWVCAIFIYLLYKINMASVCFKRNKWPWFILKASPLLIINSLRSSLFKNFFASKNYWNALTCVLRGIMADRCGEPNIGIFLWFIMAGIISSLYIKVTYFRLIIFFYFLWRKVHNLV